MEMESIVGQSNQNSISNLNKHIRELLISNQQSINTELLHYLLFIIFYAKQDNPYHNSYQLSDFIHLLQEFAKTNSPLKKDLTEATAKFLVENQGEEYLEKIIHALIQIEPKDSNTFMRGESLAIQFMRAQTHLLGEDFFVQKIKEFIDSAIQIIVEENELCLEFAERIEDNEQKILKSPINRSLFAHYSKTIKTNTPTYTPSNGTIKKLAACFEDFLKSILDIKGYPEFIINNCLQIFKKINHQQENLISTIPLLGGYIFLRVLPTLIQNYLNGPDAYKSAKPELIHLFKQRYNNLIIILFQSPLVSFTNNIGVSSQTEKDSGSKTWRDKWQEQTKSICKNYLGSNDNFKKTASPDISFYKFFYQIVYSLKYISISNNDICAASSIHFLNTESTEVYKNTKSNLLGFCNSLAISANKLQDTSHKSARGNEITIVLFQLIKDNSLLALQLLNLLKDSKMVNLVDLSARNMDGYNFLCFAALQPEGAEIIKVLLEHYHADVEDKCNSNTALYLAAKQGHLKNIEVLIAHNAIVDSANEFGWTPLMIAIHEQHKKVVKRLLLNYKASPTKIFNGFSLFYNTVFYSNNKVSIIEAILDNCGNKAELINSQNGPSKDTPLLLAIRRSYVEISSILIKHGADLNLSDKSGISPKNIAQKRASSSPYFPEINRIIKSTLSLQTASLNSHRLSMPIPIPPATSSGEELHSTYKKILSSNSLKDQNMYYQNVETQTDENLRLALQQKNIKRFREICYNNAIIVGCRRAASAITNYIHSLENNFKSPNTNYEDFIEELSFIVECISLTKNDFYENEKLIEDSYERSTQFAYEVERNLDKIINLIFFQHNKLISNGEKSIDADSKAADCLNKILLRVNPQSAYIFANNCLAPRLRRFKITSDKTAKDIDQIQIRHLELPLTMSFIHMTLNYFKSIENPQACFSSDIPFYEQLKRAHNCNYSILPNYKKMKLYDEGYYCMLSIAIDTTYKSIQEQINSNKAAIPNFKVLCYLKPKAALEYLIELVNEIKTYDKIDLYFKMYKQLTPVFNELTYDKDSTYAVRYREEISNLLKDIIKIQNLGPNKFEEMKNAPENIGFSLITNTYK